MPRLAGIRERFDKSLWDTATLEPGQKVEMFTEPAAMPTHCEGCGVALMKFGPDMGCPECGAMFDGGRSRTNKVGAVAEATLVFTAIGLRLLGHGYDDEIKLMDHLRVRFIGNDGQAYFEGIGPELSILSPMLSQAEVDEMVARSEEVIKDVQKKLTLLSDFSAEKSAANQLTPTLRAAAAPPIGRRLARPIIVSVRSAFKLEVIADRQLPRAVTARAYLFTLETREIL